VTPLNLRLKLILSAKFLFENNTNLNKLIQARTINIKHQLAEIENLYGKYITVKRIFFNFFRTPTTNKAFAQPLHLLKPEETG